MEKIKELSGYSGCLVSLYREGNNYFVKKEAKDKEYNKRLKLQIEKQKRYFSIDNKPFKVPKIINEGINSEGKYFVDMDYIAGENFIEYINTLDIEQIKEYVTRLIKVLKFFEQREKDKKDSWEKFFIKINDLLRKNINDINIINYFYNFLADNKENIKRIKSTECHGDMTLENIIINNFGEIYLIDFLDNFYDCFYFDIAKIYQDLEFKWYKIKKNEDVNIFDNKIEIFKKEFDKKIKENYLYERKLIKFISLLNLLRILPYAEKEDKIYYMIKNIIQNNLKFEEE